jgi:sRNA-binding protein
LAPELLDQAIAFYSSAFGYQQQLQAGAKRIDLAGRVVGTVTTAEENAARKYVSERKAAMGERNDEQREVLVEKIAPKLSPMPIPAVKESPTPKAAVKTNGVLEPLPEREIGDEIDRAYLSELTKAGAAGLTSEEMCERILGRELTTAEVAAVAYVDEADHANLKVSLQMFDAIIAGQTIETGERRNGLIVWATVS